MADSDRTLFDHDPATGVTEFFHYDEATGGFTIETRQNVGQFVDVLKARYNETDTHTRYGDGLTHVAELPFVVLMDLSKKGIVTPAGRILDDKKFRAWLNDSDNRFFRVRAGRV